MVTQLLFLTAAMFGSSLEHAPRQETFNGPKVTVSARGTRIDFETPFVFTTHSAHYICATVDAAPVHEFSFTTPLIITPVPVIEIDGIEPFIVTEMAVRYVDVDEFGRPVEYIDFDRPMLIDVSAPPG